ncbi:J domain-containing protein [Haloarchaeobius litoreus]|uniref:J domain-containing protein n=1 Tax=Haloarchaeobius litoreus TaxID=755306 RepID=A0ABD6DNU5_9EURY|nr:DnaJ domain-containing protein [Haloarchaeobius litoreus]
MTYDYYSVLDLENEAPIVEVQRKYREKVKETHPDVSENPNSERQFRQVREAYEVLSDREKRSRYHQAKHDHFVAEFGGFTSEELEQVNEVHIQSADVISKAQAEPIDSTTSETSKASQRDTKQVKDPMSLWEILIQGRIASNDHTWVYAVRNIAFLTLLYVIFRVIEVFNSPVDVAGAGLLIGLVVALALRGVYLTWLHSIRKSHIKIDHSPEPDAFAIPAPFAVGVVGYFLSLFLVFSPEIQSLGNQLFISISSFAGFWGVIILLIGYFGIILAIGWGTADDYYNLKYEINPPLWNFVIQLPLFLIIAVLSMGTGPVFRIAISIIMTTPFVIAILYMDKYHSEIFHEVGWKVRNFTG